MRIISGLLKGKSVKFIKSTSSRPLRDSVKENIFNILKHSNLINVKIEKANILDLYSGIGSFGLECISRGAKKVIFIEKDKNISNVLDENLLQLSVSDKASIINDKIENALKNYDKEKFDIFFLDPPFADKKFVDNLNLINKNKIYKTRHVIIIHREINTEDDLENFINVIDTKRYGRSKIIFGVFS